MYMAIVGIHFWSIQIYKFVPPIHHTVNDVYHLIKLKPNHFLLFSFFPPPNFFPSSPLPASPQPLMGGAGGVAPKENFEVFNFKR